MNGIETPIELLRPPTIHFGSGQATQVGEFARSKGYA
jgi:hypothetical protein